MFARDGHQVEAEHVVHLRERVEAIARARRGVGDASLGHRERAGQIQIVFEALVEARDPCASGAAGATRTGELREQPYPLAQMVETLRGLAQRGDREMHARAVVREEAL